MVFFKYFRDIYITNFLNENVINLLKILESNKDSSILQCKKFMECAIDKLCISRSTFFRYLDGLISYQLVLRTDLGIDKYKGRMVYYEISQEGLEILNMITEHFGKEVQKIC